MKEENNEKLFNAKDQLAFAVDAAELGTWDLDPLTGSVTVNERLKNWFGIGPHEEINDAVSKNILAEKDRIRIKEAMAGALRGDNNGNYEIEYTIRNIKTKQERIVRAKGKALLNDQKKPYQFNGIVQDITSEVSGRELEEKVRERTRELEDANAELERKNKELESFAYVSSHDLQEPLRKINTFISRIEKEGLDSDPERVKDFFKRIKTSATRMQVLISDLLSFSSTNTYKKEFVKTDLNDILKDVMVDLHDTLQRTNTVISVDNLPSASVIVFQFYQLFTNLITNAIKFAKKDSQPHISISGSYIKADGTKHSNNQLSRDHYHITFRDNGIGFEPQYASRIFEVFQRLHGREEYEGTGIGLAICKKIVENHQGVITAEGEQGKGAQFHIYIPV